MKMKVWVVWIPSDGASIIDNAQSSMYDEFREQNEYKMKWTILLSVIGGSFSNKNITATELDSVLFMLFLVFISCFKVDSLYEH